MNYNNSENKVERLTKNLQIKENEKKGLNNSLIQEKITSTKLTQELKSLKETNKELTNKLDNISDENNKNVSKVLAQLENGQIINKNLESEISQLKNKEKENNIKNKELEKELKNKEEEIENIKKKIPKKSSVYFEYDSKAGEYDIVININSFKSLLNEGWKIKYNKEEGREKYNKKKTNLQ